MLAPTHGAFAAQHAIDSPNCQPKRPPSSELKPPSLLGAEHWLLRHLKLAARAKQRDSVVVSFGKLGSGGKKNNFRGTRERLGKGDRDIVVAWSRPVGLHVLFPLQVHDGVVPVPGDGGPLQWQNHHHQGRHLGAYSAPNSKTFDFYCPFACKHFGSPTYSERNTRCVAGSGVHAVQTVLLHVAVR